MEAARKTVSTSQSLPEDARQRLIDAATGLFAERGYSGTTSDAIAEVAGVTTGAIFWHFGSEAGLLLEVVEEVLDSWESELTELLRRARGAHDLGHVLAAHRAFVEEHSTVGRLRFVLLFEALGPRPELRPAFERFDARFRALARAWCERAIAAGEIPASVDPAGAASVLTAALNGLHLQWHVDPEGVDLDRAYRSLSQLLAEGLSGEIDPLAGELTARA
jgi:AcrR family transcriptional regulator